MSYSIYYNQMPDGTIKQLNPFTKTEVWSVPGRGNKPITNDIPKTSKKIAKIQPENYCNFCESKLFETPPEKSRLIIDNGKFRKLDYLLADDYSNSKAIFRRVPNLFEIVTIDYWRKNYDFKMNSIKSEWKKNYLSTEKGYNHVLTVLDSKLKLSGRSIEDLNTISKVEKIFMSDSFFGGGHELIIADKHFKDNAEWDVDLYSSGEMTPEMHCEYLKFTIDAMVDIFESNRYVRYISVFQNWLKPAGASFDHLHKQLVALDDWGNAIEEQSLMVREDPNVFNSNGANIAANLNLVVAENDFAIAYSGIGHRFPTLEIFSKSVHSRPSEHSPEELRGFSDLVHACHAASGSQISCNEEWYYSPIDSIDKMPWHILIKWRTNITAGFEGGTKIFINPVSPIDLRDKIVPRLYKLRDEGKLGNINIAEECKMVHNPLQYYKS
jgi:galactose-1-phosphate uridylyltransferase